MPLLRRFLKDRHISHVKIYHKVHKEFHTVGLVNEVRDELNIAKITFIDVKGKKKNYWFHLFTGSVVTLPKKKGEWAKDVDPESEKAYMLSVEPVYPYDIYPELDINYKGPESKSETIKEEVDNESQTNPDVTKLK